MSKHTNTSTQPYVVKPFGHIPDVVIYINNEDLLRYRYLVKQVRPNEVQWYAKVQRNVISEASRSKSCKRDLYYYEISDMFIPEQEVSQGAVDTDVKKDPMKMYRLMLEIEGRYPDSSNELGFDQEKANADILAMHCWCHSHPFTNSPRPSGQDDSMFEEWVQENQMAQDIDTPMVALIFGSGEKIHARVYDPRVPGVMFDDVDVHIGYREDFDTSYMDAAVTSKIKQRSYKWGSTHVRCSDGVYRLKKHAEDFEKKQVGSSTGALKAPAVEAVDPEEAAGKFFDRHFEGDWGEFVKKTNLKYRNEDEIVKLWNFMNRWLSTQLERTMFVFAMTDSPDELAKVADLDQQELFLLNDEDALIVLVGHYSTDTLSNVLLKSALTFAKRYCKQEDAKGRIRAVEAFRKACEQIPLQNEVWKNASDTEEAVVVEDGYGFVDDQTDLVPYTYVGDTWEGDDSGRSL